MSGEGQDLLRQPESALQSRSMDDILLSFAQREKGDEHVERYVVDGEITASHLHSLPQFPFEVGIIVFGNGKRILTSGNEKEVNKGKNIQSEQVIADFHSHPKHIPVQNPSFGDVRNVSFYTNRSNQPYLDPRP